LLNILITTISDVPELRIEQLTNFGELYRESSFARTRVVHQPLLERINSLINRLRVKRLVLLSELNVFGLGLDFGYYLDKFSSNNGYLYFRAQSSPGPTMENDQNNNHIKTKVPQPQRGPGYRPTLLTPDPIPGPSSASRPFSPSDYGYPGPPAPAAIPVLPESMGSPPNSPTRTFMTLGEDVVEMGKNKNVNMESNTFIHSRRLDNCIVPFKYDMAEEFVITAGYNLPWNTVIQQQEIDSIFTNVTNEEFESVLDVLHGYFNREIQVPGDQNPPSEYIRSYWNYAIYPYYFSDMGPSLWAATGNSNGI
jgi:hypothetical protein